MPYTPNNPQVYIAAFAGALAGMGGSERLPTDPIPTSADYVGLATVAGAFAQELDTLIAPTTTLTDLAVREIQGLCYGVWADRYPEAVPPLTTPSNYLVTCSALAAIVQAGANYFVANGIDQGEVGGTSVAIAQPEWFVAGTTGSDTADGKTALTPLQTVGELYKRYGDSYPLLPGIFSPLVVPHTETVVHILEDLAVGDTLRAHASLPAVGLFAFLGLPTTLRSGTVTGFTALTPATNQAFEITDGLVDWTTEVGKRIRITNNVNGNLDQIYWITKAVALGTAQVNAPETMGDTTIAANILKQNPTPGTIAIGDTYVVESLPKVVWSDVDVRGPIGGLRPATCGYMNLAVSRIAGPLGPPNVLVSAAKCAQKFVACSFDGVEFDPIGTVNYRLVNCCFTNTGFSGDLAYHTFQGGAAVDCFLIARPGGGLVIRNNFLSQGGFGIFSAGGGVTLTDVGVFDSLGGGVTCGGGQFDGSGVGGEVMSNGTLYGQGNATGGVDVLPGGQFAYRTLPTITGANDFTVGNFSATARAFDEAAGVYGPALATTWTLLAAAQPGGFGGSAHKVQDNSHVLAAVP